MEIQIGGKKDQAISMSTQHPYPEAGTQTHTDRHIYTTYVTFTNVNGIPVTPYIT